MFKYLKPNLKTLRIFYDVDDSFFKDLEFVTDLYLGGDISCDKSVWQKLTSLRKLELGDAYEGHISKDMFKQPVKILCID